MKVKNIKDDYEWLKKVSKPVDYKTDDIDKIINVLRDYCTNNEVFAMASIQLGYDKRIIYVKNTSLSKAFDSTWNEERILINPVIKSCEGLAVFWESCASCFDNIGCMLRPYKLVIEFRDVDNKKHVKTFKGFRTIVIAHEYDHLDGILHIEKALKVYNMVEEDRILFRKEHPYQIISKNGNYNDLYDIYYKKFDFKTDNVIF